ncbi:MAG: hypothetical protein IIZ46_06220 [Clostridia bacterium]|nr:hypothetical protein [Clostridia bacterium]MBQ2347772.1 hypothetical protein [Clostridia bacterium]
MNIVKNDTILCTKKRLFLLFILNFSDWICTLSLLATGYFEEANPLMKNIIANPLAGFIVKAAMPFVLIMTALYKIKNSDSKQLLIANNICLVGVSVYLLINIYHIICFSLIHFVF